MLLSVVAGRRRRCTGGRSGSRAGTLEPRRPRRSAAHADAGRRRRHSRADRRAPRRRPPAAARPRRDRRARATASSSSRQGDQVVGCAELAPLSRAVAEVRSLVVDEALPRPRPRPQLVDELNARARATASRRCARSRTRRLFRPAWDFRSCRTRGCRRRSTDCVNCPSSALRAVRHGAAAARPLVAHDAGRSAAVLAMPEDVVPIVPHRADDRRRRHARVDTLRDPVIEPRRCRLRSPVPGGVTAPAGFRSAGVHCGIKASPAPSICAPRRRRTGRAAGVFTTNLAQAAPVLVSKAHLAAQRRPRPGRRRQQRLRQRLHRRRRAWPTRADGRRSRRARSAASRGSAGRVDRRHRRVARSTQGDAGHHRGARRRWRAMRTPTRRGRS